MFCVTLSLRCIDSVTLSPENSAEIPEMSPRTAGHTQSHALPTGRTARRCTRARNRFGIRMSNRGPNHIWQFQEFASACLHLLIDCPKLALPQRRLSN